MTIGISPIPKAPLDDNEAILASYRRIVADFEIPEDRLRAIWYKAELLASTAFRDDEEARRHAAEKYFHWKIRTEMVMSLGQKLREACGEPIRPDMPPTALWS